MAVPTAPSTFPVLAVTVNSTFGMVPGDSQKATAALPPWEVLSGLWGIFATSLWRSVRPPAHLPAPPAHFGVTITGNPVRAAQQICAVWHLLCGHLFVLLLPLNGGKQTF